VISHVTSLIWSPRSIFRKGENTHFKFGMRIEIGEFQPKNAQENKKLSGSHDPFYFHKQASTV